MYVAVVSSDLARCLQIPIREIMCLLSFSSLWRETLMDDAEGDLFAIWDSRPSTRAKIHSTNPVSA